MTTTVEVCRWRYKLNRLARLHHQVFGCLLGWMWQWSDVLLERSYSLVYLNCVKHFSDWSIFSTFWWFTINFRNYATFEGFLDKQYFSLHTRFFAESKLEALSNARRPAVCKASGKPLTGLLPASVAQSIKLLCRRKTGSYCRTNDESLLAG